VPLPRLHPLLRVALYLGTFLLIQTAVTIAVTAIAFLLPGERLGPGSFLRSNEAVLLIFALGALPVWGVTQVFVRFLDRRTLADLGVRWPIGDHRGRRRALRELVTLPLGVLALLGGWFLVLLALPPGLAVVRFGGLSRDMAAGRPWWPLPPALLFPVLLLLFLIQGGIEELTVRGYVYRALRERWRPPVAALASSVLFALLHATNPGVSAVGLVNVVLAGLVLAALVERSHSLWGATVAHGVWNFAVACLASLPVSGFSLFHLLNVSVAGAERVTGGGFGPEGSLALTALGLPLALWLWSRTARGRVRTPEDTLPSAPEDGRAEPPSGEGTVHFLQDRA
jgi:uncharacterized protein